jgi:catechol 2,3-dioxygenase-like lactoylglutathione lyase family enzyme
VTSQAVLYVHALESQAAFYRDGLGLDPIEAGDGYVGLQAGGLVLWLVHGRQTPAPDTDATGSARRRSEVPVKLGFAVDNIERAAGVVRTFAGTVARECWEFAGYRRCDAVDPEGNVIQLLEPLV